MITLNEAIEHFESVAKYAETGGQLKSESRNIAQWLKRLKYLEEKLSRKELVEVRHGEWKPDTEYYDDGYNEFNIRRVFSCSLCGRAESRREPYCNCGAKMDGERREDNEQRKAD